MIQTLKPEIFQDLQVHYYDAGIYIRSTINMSKYGIKDNNYSVPITLLTNNTYGFKIIHGLYVHTILNSVYTDLIFNNTELMMNSSENWILFVPFRNYGGTCTEDDILSPLFEDKKCTRYFNSNRNMNDLSIDHETPNRTYTFGLGVE